MFKYFYPQWLGKTRYPKYTMNFFLWIPLIIFFVCRFFYFRKFYFFAKHTHTHTRTKFAASFIKWTLLSYIFLTLGFLYFPLHSIDKFPNWMLKGWRAKYPQVYDFFSYNKVPWLAYLAFVLYFLCKWQAWKYNKKVILQPQNGKNDMVIIEKDLAKIRWIGTGFFLLWFWFLYCNTCVGWYFPFDWQ